jgi:hypothetical protein
MLFDVKLSCPHCGREFKLKDAGHAEAYLEVAELAAAIGRDAWPATALYLGCFKTAPNRSLTPAKLTMLLREIAGILEGERFRFDGTEHAVSRRVIVEAMRYVGMLEKTGLPNHNYLKKVLIDYLGKHNRAVARAEREREEHLRRGNHDREGGAARVREILQNLGGLEGKTGGE